MDFVGITLDIPKQEARLPEDKLVKCKELLEKFLERKRCSLKEMQSLIRCTKFCLFGYATWKGLFAADD